MSTKFKMWLKLFVLVLFGISTGLAQDEPACKTEKTCDCCKSNPENGGRYLWDICNSQNRGWICEYGCQDGYWGDKCWNKCAASCISCQRNKNRDGTTECYSCVDGYYGTECKQICPSNCAEKKCDKTTGDCFHRCVDGYYGPKCQTSCPQYCTRCARYFGGQNSKDNQICYRCADGYYNGTEITNCSTPCPANCAENQCDKSTGICLLGCINNLTGDKCDVCPDYCKDRVCNSNGDCTNGCADDNFVGLKCNLCIVGKYGNKCNESCPVNCNFSRCDRNGGQCTFGCNGNFDGKRCDKCKPNHYGTNCENVCSNCLNGDCDQSTGRCIDCVDSQFGELCDKSCSHGCKKSICDRSSAVCTQGCRPGYSGDKCCVTSQGCEKCDSTTKCVTCKTGSHGDACEMFCHVNCNGTCDKGTGKCKSCNKDEFYGDQCDSQCPKNCSNGECDRDNGQCTSCQIGYYGQTCDETCPTNCEGNVCDQHDGICHNCTVGFYGYVCDTPCRKDCKERTCFQDSGDCVYGCINGCEKVVEPSSPSPLGGAIGGAVGGLVVIAFVIVGVWFVLKRRRSQQETNTKYNSDELMPDINPAVVNNGVYENCDSVTTRETISAAPKVVPKQKEDFHNVALEESHEPDTEENEVDDDYYTFRNVIKVADLQAYVKQNVGNYLSNEFKRLAKGLKQPCTFATRSENIALNRYNGLYPYDHSRVKLPHDKKFFINACYINGNHQLKAYIASLGPTKVTTDNFATFWKMVWYEKSDIIVMLTNLQEPSGMKCQQYWPDRRQSLTFYDLEIKCDSIEDFSEYTLRTFTVFKGKERRTVSQLHFTAWPDKSIPNNVTSLIEFRQRVKSTYTLSQGPVIVHCSAGIGRTGTYIAIDLLTEEGLNKGHVDVFGCIRNMRDQRVNMVQTPDQYEYVHRAIVYTLIFDVDYTPTETFNEYVMSLTDSQYAAIHKKLSISIETVNKEHEKAVSINKTYKEKNRSISDVPDNSSRPMLYLNRAFNDSNYINAVYVDGFKRKNRFILAQTPLSSTLDDYVCLLYQEKCSCIVSVEIADDQKHDVGCYIPAENESLTFGSFVVTCMKYQNKYNHQYRQLKITNNGKQSTGERIVHHYQYTNWKNNEKVPSSDADFVQFIKDTQSKVHEDGQAPMILHCLTGGKKCGLFCTVSLLLERADVIRQISVVNTVRLLRLRRPNVIPNKEQLKFAHQCVASQMEMLSTYTNFSMK